MFEVSVLHSCLVATTGGPTAIALEVTNQLDPQRVLAFIAVFLVVGMFGLLSTLVHRSHGPTSRPRGK